MVSQARLHNELEQESQDITQNQHLPAVFRYRHNNISVMGPTENIFERRQTVRWLPPRARPREQTTNNTAERHEGVVAAAANGRDIWEEIERMTMVQREQQERIDRLETENAQLRGRVADVELVNGQLQHRAANTDAETAHLRHLVLLLEENIDQLEYQVAETDYTGLHCRIARLEDIEARGDQEHDDEFWPYDDFSEDWDEDDAGDTRVQDELHDLEDQAADTEYLYEDLPMWAGPYDDGAWDGPYDDDLWHEPVSSDEYESEEVRPRGVSPLILCGSSKTDVVSITAESISWPVHPLLRIPPSLV